MRWLVWHGESDCLFEVFNRIDLDNCLGQGCDEVTGVKKFELEFKRQMHDDNKGEKDMKLEVAMLVGPESKAFLTNLTQQLDRMEKLVAGAVVKTAKSQDEAPVKTKAKAKAAPVVEEEESFDDFGSDDDLADEPANSSSIGEEDDFESEDLSASDDMPSDDFSDDFEEEAATPKKAAPTKKAATPAPAQKTKKVTVEDCSDAAAARAKVETQRYKGDGKKGREAVKALMKKHFNVTSVQDIPEKSYGAFIKLMSGK